MYSLYVGGVPYARVSAGFRNIRARGYDPLLCSVLLCDVFLWLSVGDGGVGFCVLVQLLFLAYYCLCAQCVGVMYSIFGVLGRDFRLFSRT